MENMRPHEVVLAWEEGKKIEWSIKYTNNNWAEKTHGQFDFDECKYRIKKEPIEDQICVGFKCKHMTEPYPIKKFDSLVGKRIKHKESGYISTVIGDDEHYYYYFEKECENYIDYCAKDRITDFDIED